MDQDDELNYEQRYQRLVDNRLTHYGFDTSKLDINQKYLIVQPMDGPENYCADGEWTEEYAFSNWMSNLRRSGLEESDIQKALKLNGFIK